MKLDFSRNVGQSNLIVEVKNHLRDPADDPTGSPSAELTRLPLNKGTFTHLTKNKELRGK